MLRSRSDPAQTSIVVHPRVFRSRLRGAIDQPFELDDRRGGGRGPRGGRRGEGTRVGARTGRAGSFSDVPERAMKGVGVFRFPGSRRAVQSGRVGATRGVEARRFELGPDMDVASLAGHVL